MGEGTRRHRPVTSGRPHILRTIVIAALCVLGGCATLRQDPVQVYVVGIEPLQGEGLELRMLVKLRVQNPNDTPIQFNGIYVDLDVQNRPFASGVSDAAGEVPRFGETVVSVPVSVSAFRLVRSAIGTFSQPTDKIEYSLNGKLAGPVFNTVRFNAKGEMALPKGVYTNDGQ